LDPVTWMDAALVSVTVSVSDWPAEMLLELALMETVGTEAAALLANAKTARKLRSGARDENAFMGPALSEFIWNILGTIRRNAGLIR
jgi:hypothetical protein